MKSSGWSHVRDVRKTGGPAMLVCGEGLGYSTPEHGVGVALGQDAYNNRR